MRLVPAIILAVAVLLAPLIWIFVPRLLPQHAAAFDGPAIDSGARIDLEMLRGDVEALGGAVETLRGDLVALGARVDALPVLAPGLPTPSEQSFDDSDQAPSGPGVADETYAQVVLIFDRTNVNDGLSVAGPSLLETMLGRPRQALSDTCEPMTNPKLKQMLVRGNVGPVPVNMLRPAVESLTRVFEQIRVTDPTLYGLINTAGSLCVRRIRGTRDRLSTHAFGLAIDLNINGVLDNFTDGKTQMGLIVMADFFHAEGWIWGAGFRREDSMHFEVSREKLEEWRGEGLL